MSLTRLYATDKRIIKALLASDKRCEKNKILTDLMKACAIIETDGTMPCTQVVIENAIKWIEEH